MSFRALYIWPIIPRLRWLRAGRDVRHDTSVKNFFAEKTPRGLSLELKLKPSTFRALTKKVARLAPGC